MAPRPPTPTSPRGASVDELVERFEEAADARGGVAERESGIGRRTGAAAASNNMTEEKGDAPDADAKRPASPPTPTPPPPPPPAAVAPPRGGGGAAAGDEPKPRAAAAAAAAASSPEEKKSHAPAGSGSGSAATAAATATATAGGGGGRPPRPPPSPPPRTAKISRHDYRDSRPHSHSLEGSESDYDAFSSVSMLTNDELFPTPPPPQTAGREFVEGGKRDGGVVAASGHGGGALPRAAPSEESGTASAPRAGPGNVRERGVSFDFQVNHDDATRFSTPSPANSLLRKAPIAMAPAPAQSILQPDLNQFPTRRQPSTRSTASVPRGHVRKQTKITLAQVAASPLEDEAETAILKALETREWEQHDDNAKFNKVMAKTAEHRRNRTATSALSVLRNVPDGALEMLAEEEEKAKAKAAAEGGGGASSSAPSVEAKPSADTSDTARTPPSPSEWPGGRPGTPPPRPGPASAEGAAKPTFKDVATRLQRMQKASAAMGGAGAAGGGGGGGGGGRKTDFLKAAKKAESRRTLADSVGPEEGPAADAPPSPPPEKRKSLIQPIEKITGAPGAKPVSAGDALVNDAAILLGQEMEEEDAFMDLEAQRHPGPGAGAPPSAGTARNLSKLRGAVRAARALAAMKGAKADVPSKGKENEWDDDEHRNEGSEDQFGEEGNGNGNGNAGMPSHRRRSLYRYQARQRARSSIILEVLRPKWPHIKIYTMTALFVIILPMLLVASVLFYAVGNPIAGCAELKDKSNCASYSWWIIFLGIRQVITLSLAKATEVIVVEIIALRTKLFVRILGPYLTLFTVQARGWPFVIFFWAAWGFILLYGNFDFPKHWLYWQRRVEMMNGENPAGVITHSDIYMRTLVAVIVFGFCVGVKRGWLAIYLGKNSVRHYGDEIEKLMQKMLLISDVAHLSEEVRDEHFDDFYGAIMGGTSHSPLNLSTLRGGSYEDDDDDSASDRVSKALPSNQDSAGWSRLRKSTEDMVKGVSSRTAGTSEGTRNMKESLPARPTLEKQPHTFTHLSKTAKFKLAELVGEWEEPEIKAGSQKDKDISIKDVLQFRQAVGMLDNRYPFSVAFGSASSRELCIESAQAVFEDLLLRTPHSEDLLPFETIAIAALQPSGLLDEEKARRLLRMFRPDRNGNLSALDFVKSVDKVYKKLRTLRAAIANSSQIDRAFERLVNFFFYFLLCMASLTIVRLDPWHVFLSLSGFLLGFSFLFGSAASRAFEGILLILVRRPYDIGDRVAISNPQNDTSPNGSSCWFVEGISLYTTTVRFATTNEVATYSNGSLAQLRIINAQRSPNATVYIYLKFASDIPYESVMVFKSVVERFVNDRPRQWLSMSAFRATRVEADLGFIEYVLVLVHVEKWQNIGPILTSKAEVSSYCLEVQKKLDMRYSAPPLPVNLALVSNGVSPFESGEIGADAGAAQTTAPDLGAIGEFFMPSEAKKTK